MLKWPLVIACIFSACAKPPAHVKATDVSMKKFCKEVSESKGVRILGSGGFFEDRKVRGFYADFESGLELSKEEAKLLLSDLVVKCVDELNKDSSLQKHLVKFPIDVSHVSISIGFVGPDRKPYQTLSQIHLFEGKVYYSTFDPAQKAYVCNQSEAFALSHQTASLPPPAEEDVSSASVEP